MDIGAKIVLNFSMFYRGNIKSFLINIIFPLLILFMSGCTINHLNDKESEFHYKMGLSYLNEGNIQMAYVQLYKAYQINPNDKEIINSLGLVYLQLEDLEKAREMFIKAISIDPNYSDAHHNLGVTYMYKGQFDKAIESFTMALSNPLYLTPEKSFYLLGLSYYRLKRYDSAVDAFKGSIRRSPNFELPYYGLALSYNKMGRFSDATIAITKAIEKDPLHKGDKNKFIEFVKIRLLSAKDYEEADLRDLLELIN